MKLAALVLLCVVACAPLTAQNVSTVAATIPESRESLPAHGALVVARR